MQRNLKWILLICIGLVIIGSMLMPEMSVFGLPMIPVVGMALGRSRDRFSVKGGGLLKTAVIASGGALTSMDDLGTLDESGITIDRKMVEFIDEVGNVINVISGGEDWKFDTILQQSSIDEINLAREADTVYRHLYYMVKLQNGRFQEIYIPLCKIVSVLEMKFKAPDKRTIKVTWQALMPKGAVTVTPAGLNVPADAYGVIVENAAAVGQVTTSTGTIYTAAF